MEESRSLAIPGKPGRYMSIASGPNADITPRVHASLRVNPRDSVEGMLFMAESVNWIERSGPAGRGESKDDAHSGGKEEGDGRTNRDERGVFFSP